MHQGRGRASARRSRPGHARATPARPGRTTYVPTYRTAPHRTDPPCAVPHRRKNGPFYFYELLLLGQKCAIRAYVRRSGRGGPAHTTARCLGATKSDSWSDPRTSWHVASSYLHIKRDRTLSGRGRAGRHARTTTSTPTIPGRLQQQREQRDRAAQNRATWAVTRFCPHPRDGSVIDPSATAGRTGERAARGPSRIGAGSAGSAGCPTVATPSRQVQLALRGWLGAGWGWLGVAGAGAPRPSMAAVIASPRHPRRRADACEQQSPTSHRNHVTRGTQREVSWRSKEIGL